MQPLKASPPPSQPKHFLKIRSFSKIYIILYSPFTTSKVAFKVFRPLFAATNKKKFRQNFFRNETSSISLLYMKHRKVQDEEFIKFIIFLFFEIWKVFYKLIWILTIFRFLFRLLLLFLFVKYNISYNILLSKQMGNCSVCVFPQK